MSALTWALTIPQPAAWAIANGHQDVYSRTADTDHRGWIALCAGVDISPDLLAQAVNLTGWTAEEIVDACPERNAIVAVARLTEVCDRYTACDCGPWVDRRLLHWRLADVTPLPEPIPAPRMLGLWQMSYELSERVQDGWTRARGTATAARPDEEEPKDSRTLRDELLPLPDAAAGYRRVLLLGTTGAGKTTVVRQLLGTDPRSERFPSTSTAKTTVADTEVVLTGEQEFRAAVTFADREEIAVHLRDNVWEAAKAVYEARPDDVVYDKLLDHVSQRYRFSYLLGRPALSAPERVDDLDDDLDLLDDEPAEETPANGTSDPRTADMLHEAVKAIRHLVNFEMISLQGEITTDGDDRSREEIVEDELENRIRRSPVSGRIVAAMLAEIEARFERLPTGRLHRDADGWPVSWSWSCPDRAEFLHTVNQFSSNHTERFGTLLTPLVNGIRVAGPFRPRWAESTPRLVLIDGEGMGHIHDSATEVSTRLRKRLDEVDAIVLVDNAQQPMQAAPVAVMRTAATTGNGDKLFFLFTHFDLVHGDNLRTAKDRARHVLNSAENVLNAIRQDLGIAERVLRNRLDTARYFVGGIDKRLDPAGDGPSRQAVQQFDKLVRALMADAVEVEVGPARPVYKRERVTEAAVEAARSFHRQWRGVLGLSYEPGVPKRHWASIKALTRRLAEGMDEYQDLRPAASLRTCLENALYRMIQDPARWTGAEPDAKEQQVVFGTVSRAVTTRLITTIDRLITEEPRPDWQQAYEQHGKGSTFRRARILDEDVYTPAVPYPGAGDPYDNAFTRAIHAAFAEAAAEHDFLLD